MKTNGLKENDKCTVTLDYSDSHKGKRVQILRFTQHGILTCARVLWLGRDSKSLAAELGTIFPVKDLTKVNA